MDSGFERGEGGTFERRIIQSLCVCDAVTHHMENRDWVLLLWPRSFCASGPSGKLKSRQQVIYVTGHETKGIIFTHLFLCLIHISYMPM
jgi:hypothetical protein